MIRLWQAWPHLLVAGLCLGLALANIARPGWEAAFVGAAMAVLSVVAARSPWRLALLGGALLAVGWGWGSARLDAIDRSSLAPLAGETAPARVTVTGPPRRGRYALRVPARVERFGRLRVREPILLELPLGRAPPQGAILDTVGRLRLPFRSRRGFDEGRWLRLHGVHVVLRAHRWRLVGRRGGLGGVADRLREWVAAGASAGLGGERRAVVLGLVLGEDEGLADPLRAQFRASGLYHLLAVSGQNVALVAGGTLAALWLAGVSRLLAQVAALLAILAYVLAVGFQPSVVRAGVAGALACLAWICARERDRWWFLLLGALALLAWSPYSLLDPGFQLSFAAVASIFVLAPRLGARLEGYPLPRRAAALVAVTAACSLATAPILLLQFGAVPAYALAANALAAPAVAPLLGLSLGAALLHPLAPGAAQILAALAGWCASWLALCARAVASLPHAQLSAGEVLLATLAGSGWLLLVRSAPPGRRWRRAGALLGLAAALWAGWGWIGHRSRSWSSPSGLRATFLDVGQGDAALLETPEGAVLVDEGPPEADVARVLRQRGLSALSAVVLTHPQRDHIGGAEAVVRGLRVGSVLYPRLAVSSADERRALAAAREKGVAVAVARAGDEYGLGRLRLRVLWPDGPGRREEDPNEHAVVLLASYGETDLLLPADAESEVTSRLSLPPVEVLKVAHHGSRDPGLADLLRRLRPRLAVISVGRDNDYGHPAPSTLAALATIPGLRVYRTDEAGDVVVESDGHALAAHAER